jgi:hypothetical protein
VSGYLTRLIARSNGSEAIVRPLLTPHVALRDESAFAPAPDAARPVADRGDQHRPDEPARTLERITEPSASAPNRPARSDAPAAAERRASSSTPAEPARPVSTPAARPAAINDQPRPQIAGAEHPAGRPTSVPADPPSPTLAGPGAPVEGEPAATAFQPLQLAPEPTGAEPSAPAGMRDVAPVIRISIGRIEIRAVPPRSSAAGTAQAARSARPLSVTPKLTLDEYLQRDEARR